MRPWAFILILKSLPACAAAAMALSWSSLSPQSRHFANRLLLGLVRDEFTGIATPETEGDLTAIPAPRLLIRLHLPDASRIGHEGVAGNLRATGAERSGSGSRTIA